MLEAILIIGLVVALQLWQTRSLPDGAAPPLDGTTQDGRSRSLEALLKESGGRPVLVGFWATWCPVCKAEEGNVEAVSRDWPTLTVAMQSGDAAAVASHLTERGRSFTALVDTDGQLASQWKVRGVPTHFIVDSQGHVRFQLVGYTSELGLRARLWWVQRFPQ